MIPRRMCVTMAVSAALSATPTAPASAGSPTSHDGLVVSQVLHPVIDTDARGMSRTATHWLRELEVANTADQDADESSSAYLRFDVSHLPGEVEDASLELAGLRPTTPLTLRTDYVADDSWVPTGERAERPQYQMTGATKPPSTPIEGTERPYDSGLYRASVGQAARTTQTGDGLLSLRVLAPAPAPSARAVFGSDENPTGALRPRLVVKLRLKGTAIGEFQAARAALDQARRRVRTETPVKDDLPFARRGAGGTKLSWSSWNTDQLTDDGTVTRPSAEFGDRTVPVDLTVTNGATTLTDRLLFTIKARGSARPAVPASAEVERVARDARVDELIRTRWDGEFQHVTYPTQNLAREVTVAPGQSIQAAVDQLGADGLGGVVRLVPGVYQVDSTINLKSRITLVGAGAERTEIHYTGVRAALSTTTTPLTDVVVKDLTLSGTRGSANIAHGILLEGKDPVSARNSRLAFQNLDIHDFGVHGVHVKRGSDIVLTGSRVHHNGEANGLYHNVYWLFDNNILMSGDDMSDPVRGKGAKFTSTSNVIAQDSRVDDSKVNGIQADSADDTKILFHHFDVTDSGKTGLWFICEIFSNPNLYTEDPQYAPRHVIISGSRITGNRRGGVWKIASDVYVTGSTFDNVDSDLLLLKSEPEFHDTTFRHPPFLTDDPTRVPQF